MNNTLVYTRFERFWHWAQAFLIMFLALTGFEVHGSIDLFGFEKAVEFHRIASYALLLLIAFAIFWHFTTGQWKHYIPTTEKIRDQILFYSIGIFKGEKHPIKPSKLSKLNPLQRIVYFGFKLILIPLVIITGILFLYHKTINQNDIIVISGISLELIAVLHTLGAFLLIAFLIVHVYMTSTGHTPTSNIKAMITGYEEIENENVTPEILNEN